MAAALEAVEAEATEPAEGVLVELVTDEGSAELLVPPVGKWKTRAQAALASGDLDRWAQITLFTEDVDAWRELDPTLDDVNAFLKNWETAANADLGKSRGSSGSSKTTKRAKR